MTDRARIIVVEDDPEIRTLLQDYLQRHELRVDVADGGAALDRLLAEFGAPDLVVLDIMMPGEDGLSICRRLRATSRIPIIMLTARGDDIDRIVGLEMGADDYLAKPFNPRELLARIRAVLRRTEQAPAIVAAERLVVADLVVDMAARVVCGAQGEDRGLTAAEFDLFACFLERPGRVLSRDQLMDWTRGRRADVFDRTIDVQMSRLRRKLGGDDNAIIKTVRGAGYILAVAPVREDGR